MCIGIPGQICAIDGVLAKVEVCGIQRDVDLTLVGAVDADGHAHQAWILLRQRDFRRYFNGGRRRGASCQHKHGDQREKDLLKHVQVSTHGVVIRKITAIIALPTARGSGNACKSIVLAVF